MISRYRPSHFNIPHDRVSSLCLEALYANKNLFIVFLFSLLLILLGAVFMVMAKCCFLRISLKAKSFFLCTNKWTVKIVTVALLR
jgi:hypothetical protein